MNEEIQFGMGLDTSNFSTAMRGASRLAHETSHEIKTTFLDSFKEMFAPLAGAFAVTKLFESIKGMTEYSKQIKLNAAEAGTSTDFIQGLEAASHKLGISSETAAASVAILSRKVGEARTGSEEAQKAFDKWGVSINGLSNEQIFYQIADKMKATVDPAQRSAMAFELMGKGAKEMAAALPIGAAAIKEIVEAAPKLSDAELEKLHAIGIKLEEIGRKWKIIWGTVIGSFVQTPGGNLTEDAILKRARELDPRIESFNSMGHAPVGMSWQDVDKVRAAAIKGLTEEGEKREQISAITDGENKLLEKAGEIHANNSRKELTTAEQLHALQEKADKLNAEAERKFKAGKAYGKEELELAKTETEILLVQNKLKEEGIRLDAKAAELAAEKDRLQQDANNTLDAEQSIKQKWEDERQSKTRMTAAELAASKLNLEGDAGHDQQIARQMAVKDRQREWNRVHGYRDAANDRLNEWEELRSQLTTITDKDRDPERDDRQHLKRLENHMSKLLNMAQAKGIPIVPKLDN